jgi:hypothetical protein
MAARNEKRKTNKDDAYRRPWSMTKCNSHGKEILCSMHHTQQTKNQKCYLQNLERDHLGDLSVDEYRYNHSTPAAEETNSKTALWTRGNVIGERRV